MPFVDQLPPDLENVDHLIERRTKANTTKELWRSLYTDAYNYAMPTRETFSWTTPGAKKARLYDSTLQEATYTAANTMIATVFPPWTRWAELAPGGAIKRSEISKAIIEGLQEATEAFFNFLDHSNFATVIHETAQDLMVGTGALQFDEGDDETPFVFTSIPLSAIELEEGPNGTVETTWFPRTIKARNVARSFPGLDEFDLPQVVKDLVREKPDTDVELIQGNVYHAQTKRYYGVVVHTASKAIIWRYDYETSSPIIVARATKVAGETYGRGRVLLALDDARTLDKMMEFILRHAALQIAPPMTGVSDGVLNPYTAVLAPNTVLPVASNDQSNPSLRVMDYGGNFAIGDALVDGLRERVRRTMLGPEPSEGPVKSASEVLVNDRNRLWAMGGESGRIQAELLDKIIARGVFILQRKGIIPKFNIDGREVATKFTSPFAKSQSNEDLMAFDRVVATIGSLGPDIAAGMLQIGMKLDAVPEWASRKTGLDMSLVNDPAERKALQENAAKAATAAMQAAQAGEMSNVPGA